MIITRRWLEEFINISQISTDEICKTLNSIGLEVDSLEKQQIASKVVIGKVLSKEKHPDADKLNVCQVDLGYETTQIVCGAANVEAGQIVAVATIGAILGDDFKIKAAKLRGVESNGMICSSTELGLPKLNDGIMILDSSIGEIELGKELKDYPILNDDIIEIGLTPNRGDCLSILGVARELAAFYDLPLMELDKNTNDHELSIGQIFEINSSNIDTFLAYKAIDFSALKLDLVTNIRVSLIGKFKENHHIKNSLFYATHSIGVLLNAYPREDFILKNELSVLDLRKDDKGFDCSYSNANCLSLLCIEQKDFDEKSNDFLLEASYIDPEILSKRVFDTKIKTGDLFYKASRGSNPDINYGVNYFSSFASKMGATIYSGAKEFLEDIEKTTLSISVKSINSIIGQDIEKIEIERILTSLEFEIKESVDDILLIKVPHYRHDIKNIADIAEEVIRMVGIDNIISKPLAIDEVNRVNKTSLDLQKRNKLRYKAIENGFFETLTYVFSSKENLEKYGFKTVKDELELINPIVKELNTYRTTLLLNLIEACSNNFKIGTKSASFFEIGTIFDENRVESKKIAFVHSGASTIEDVSNAGKPKNIDFFSFAKNVLNTIGEFELEPIININNKFIHPYQSANILIDGKIVGFISKLHPSVANDFDLSDTFFAEIDFIAIKNDLIKVSSYSKFQASRKDLSIIAPKSLEFKEIKKVINSLNINLIKQYNLIDIYSDEKLGDFESLTIRFTLQSDEKTLEDDDINRVINSILDALKEKLNITLR
ncbi:phenylalanine--tRNA ligase subunit beta [Aliarcobacter trophiarum LMG 25534]|uniref:Phenylalanine--tRNA ligase beta subunit n=1 Tax=Aliarcobacter trophiarum LMG 25534 TaxID=1032241 RepID=A0AAD0QK79_9BACT|nr:phenylalanine--tRNA ligase subunit beta [Aliarcobacter trophiarum]AXK49569.1 phenylalanyl-tRNA synthetase, beta subunit [Aliarcobacter trophiarum LMG 25534]RXI27506.1 phenylalanine--tRNA ligase subunit beta [Aliarcobacter trophiarum]RXJ92245.1 phenylalanine--tRNA ligase subunit beta [Aliarcobacter trophiarum LMG 25534]